MKQRRIAVSETFNPQFDNYAGNYYCFSRPAFSPSPSGSQLKRGLSGSPMLRNAITAPICALALLTGCGKPSSSSGGVGNLTLGSQLFAIYAQGKPLNNVYAIAGQAGFTLEASGTGFTNSDVLEWNGNPLPTMVGNSTNIRGSVSAGQIAQPGTVTIQVKDTTTGVVSNTEPFGIASPATLTAGVIMLISVAPDGSSANGTSLVPPAFSATGRFVSFQSNATNLAPGPASGYQEIYERDTCLGAPSGCTPSGPHNCNYGRDCGQRAQPKLCRKRGRTLCGL